MTIAARRMITSAQFHHLGRTTEQDPSDFIKKSPLKGRYFSIRNNLRSGVQAMRLKTNLALRGPRFCYSGRDGK